MKYFRSHTFMKEVNELFMHRNNSTRWSFTMNLFEIKTRESKGMKTWQSIHHQNHVRDRWEPSRYNCPSVVDPERIFPEQISAALLRQRIAPCRFASGRFPTGWRRDWQSNSIFDWTKEKIKIDLLYHEDANSFHEWRTSSMRRESLPIRLTTDPSIVD